MNISRIEFEPRVPVNLEGHLVDQVHRLIEVGAPEHLRRICSADEFLDNAMVAIKNFTYLDMFAEIGLDQVMLVHYGITIKFLSDVCSVTTLANLAKFVPYENVNLHDGFKIIHCQLGPKYKNTRVCDVRQNHHQLEQLGLPKEGLLAYLYWGNSLLEECFMDFPGALSEDGHTPYLLLRRDEPYLVADEKDALDPWGTPEKGEIVARPRAYPDFGSVTVRRNF
jgi:hypothetical protein